MPRTMSFDMHDKRSNGVSLRKKPLPSSLLRNASADDDDQLCIPNLNDDKHGEKKKPRVLPFTQINWETYMRSGNSAVMFWLTITLSVIFFFAEEPQELHGSRHPVNQHLPSTPSIHQQQHVSRQMKSNSPSAETHHNTSRRNRLDRFLDNLDNNPLDPSRASDPNFGGLEIPLPRPKKWDAPVQIDPSDYEKYEISRTQLLDEIDGKVNSDYYPLSDKEDMKEKCQLPPWTGYQFPNCNQIHEVVTERPYDAGQTQDFEVFYLASGSYRDAWRLKRSETDHVVLKRMYMPGKNEVWGGAKDVYKIHKEAIIMERLSASPRVLDIYAFCGTSVHVETMAGDLWKKIIPGTGFASQKIIGKLDNEHLSQNQLTPSEKLQIALDMAESLADLHGFEGGPIVHADTHIEQWLIALDGSIQLNDFNNAKEPEWDAKHGEYCESHGGYGGVYRSPEEFKPSAQDESRDVFAYSNNIYTLLTGLWPHYDDGYNDVSRKDTRAKIIQGARPYVDPRFKDGSRTYIESKLVEIMEKCWRQRRKERPSIYKVVDFLHQVKQNATRIGELQPSDVIKIPI